MKEKAKYGDIWSKLIELGQSDKAILNFPVVLIICFYISLWPAT